MTTLPPNTIDRGDSSRFGLGIADIRTLDGTTIIPPARGVTVIVGANNSGKSTFLELAQTITLELGQEPQRKLLAGLSLRKNGTPDDLVAWLIEQGTYVQRMSSKGLTPGLPAPVAGCCPLL